METQNYPMASPPVKYTANGETRMGARMSRFYTFILGEGIYLGTMSTDDCVLQKLPALAKALAKAEGLVLIAEAGKGPARGATVYQMKDLVADIRCIMRRVPASRVGSGYTPVAKAVAAPVTRAVAPSMEDLFAAMAKL